MSGRIGAADILSWYHDAGVDEALAEGPIDRFAQSETIERERQTKRAPRAMPTKADLPPPEPRRAPVRRALSSEAVAAAAEEASTGAISLAALREAITNFEGCGLRETARRTVFALGNPAAKLAIVGDVPDRDEDAEGMPFAGPSGAMLERMLAAIGVASNETYRLCASPWRTPGQRQLNPGERAILSPFLLRHLELAQPELTLFMGGTGVELALGAGQRMTALRGRWLELSAGGHLAQAVCTFHPNFLMRQPEQKRLAWRDLLLLKERL